MDHQARIATDLPLRTASPPPKRATNPTLVAFASALAVWSIVYLLPHLYWGLGGTAGLSVVKPSASALPEWQAINLAASGVLALPALLAVALVAVRAGTAKSGLLLVSLAGSAIATSHGLYGIIYRSLMVAGTIDVDGQTFDASRHGWVLWDLLVFEPWFLIEGLLLAGTGGAVVAPQSRRRWVLACTVSVAMATLTGVVGIRI